MKRACFLSTLVCLGWATFAAAWQAEDGFDVLLHSIKKMEPREGRLLLRKGLQRLVDQGVDRRELGRRLAEVLPALSQTPAEVADVLGSEKQVSRQVLYRRYREQWLYDSPLPLLVVFDVRKGREAKLVDVLPVSMILP
jgi:hypothetical protein